jgi:hypothetical protein
MTAEAIGNVVRDLRVGRVTTPATREGEIVRDGSFLDTVQSLAGSATVVDSTAIYRQFRSKDVDTFLYEDHRICPPWENALVGYVNVEGVVGVVHVTAGSVQNQWDSDSGTHVIDWDRVKWVIAAWVYTGGPGYQTSGPHHIWRIPVYPDGEIADIRWIAIRPEVDRGTFDTALAVLLGTFNMCNCTNVEVREPHRRRAHARQVARTGVTVNEIHVKPVSRSYRGHGVPLSDFDAGPLSAVRGHFASYGPAYGRGLLFGKYEGRFWIPQHVRGAAEIGEREHEYVVGG